MSRQITLSQGKMAIVDDEDYDRVIQHTRARASIREGGFRMIKPYSCVGCDFHDPIGDYCFREEKDRHFVRECDRVRDALAVGNEGGSKSEV